VIRVRVVVTGRVQGVWFRESCHELARAEGIAGWIRNRSDGAVEAEFEGPEAAVERLIAWCRTGPPRAQVDGVDTQQIPIVGAAGFQVR
jgi:acylphosphatase